MSIVGRMQEETRFRVMYEHARCRNLRVCVLLLPEEILVRIFEFVLHTPCAESEYVDLSGMLDQVVSDSYIDGLQSAMNCQSRLVKKARFSPRKVHTVERMRTMFSCTCSYFLKLAMLRKGTATRQECCVREKSLVQVSLRDKKNYGPDRVVVLFRKDLHFHTFKKDSEMYKVEEKIRPLLEPAFSQNTEKFFLSPREVLVDISKAADEINKWHGSNALKRWLDSKLSWVKIIRGEGKRTIVKVRWSSWAVCAVMPPLLCCPDTAYRAVDSLSRTFDSVTLAIDARACVGVFAAIGMSCYGDEWLDVEFGEHCDNILVIFEELLVVFGAHESNFKHIKHIVDECGSRLTMRNVWNIHRNKHFAGIVSVLDLVQELECTVDHVE
jgi:hypothetical protein